MLSKDAGGASPDLVKKVRDTLASHCEKDQWSAATRTCLANIKTKDDAPKCEDTLTAAQRSSLDKEKVGGEAGGVGEGAASAPAPAPALAPNPVMSPSPPLGNSRSPTTKNPPKKGGDPEDGGD